MVLGQVLGHMLGQVLGQFWGTDVLGHTLGHILGPGRAPNFGEGLDLAGWAGQGCVGFVGLAELGQAGWTGSGLAWAPRGPPTRN